MFIIFGWVKETRETGSAFACHCYRCQGKRTWGHRKETEWVSFFMIKTIPFLSKSHAICSGCRQTIAMNPKQARLIGAEGGQARLAEIVEEHQLSQKSEVQRNYLRSQREQSESRD